MVEDSKMLDEIILVECKNASDMNVDTGMPFGELKIPREEYSLVSL